MQTAKVSAGNLLHAAEDAETVRDDLRIKILEGKKLTKVDPAAVDYSTAVLPAIWWQQCRLSFLPP